ncbi:MAG: iron reductase [Saprospiraceae bacterium]|nr:iron reductase [Saprospiraceae bacterium]
MKKNALWILLSIPGILLTKEAYEGTGEYEMLMHTSGEFSARLLIISLIATPLLVLFPKGKLSKWLLRNRRYFGVAAFGYALLHTIIYLYVIEWITVQKEFFDFAILTGWIAFFIFLPLAITSNDYSIGRMRKSWKKLQRWVYLAALCTFAHWVFVHYNYMSALIHFVPVMLLQVARVWKNKETRNPNFQ